MSTPAWMARDWLPELHLVAWGRLRDARQKHRVALNAYSMNARHLPQLRARYAAQDRAVESAMLAAVRNGDEPRKVAVTSEASRRAELQIARERSAIARSDLETAVSAIAADLLDHWDEAEEAVNEAAALVGNPGALDEDSLVPGSPEALASDCQVAADSARHLRSREVLEVDTSALRTLKAEGLEAFGHERELERA